MMRMESEEAVDEGDHGNEAQKAYREWVKRLKQDGAQG
jgi:hypothetical protein